MAQLGRRSAVRRRKSGSSNGQRGPWERRRSPLPQRPRARVIFVLSLSKDGSRFVDEDQPMRLGPHFGLSFSLPRLARLAHVGPIAFAGLKAFF